MEGYRNLKIDAVRTVFGGLEHEDQVSLIRDFMDLAKVDSIIRNNRPVFLNATEINPPENETPDAKAERLYRDAFDAWLYKTCLESLIVVEKPYLDECFELYTMIEQGTHPGMMKEGSKLTVFKGDHPHQTRVDLLKDKNRGRGIFMYDMFEFLAEDVEMVTCAFGHQLFMPLSSLFFNLYNHGKNIMIIMYIFKYNESVENHDLYVKTFGSMSDKEALEHLLKMFEGLRKDR
jgi:hypothetical protein